MTTLLFQLPVLLTLVLPSNDVDLKVVENDQLIQISTDSLSAQIRKQGYVSGVAARSLVDLKTGFHDAGFGLDIVDWIMEPGSDEAYRSQLKGDLAYKFNNLYHGSIPKRSIEGPQICTRAMKLDPQVIRGSDFLAIQQSYQYTTAAPKKKTGSTWSQTIVFPQGKRYFISSDRIDAVNGSEAMFLRTDLPGHIKHKNGDTFSEIYLSYFGVIPSSSFSDDFAPDEKFRYARGSMKLPKRMIRAYRLRDPKTGKQGPWLAGMTLDPAMVYDAWCHQRGYVCMIQEIGGRPVKPGGHFGAAYIIGYFDSIEEMNHVYDQHSGNRTLHVDSDGWKLTP